MNGSRPPPADEITVTGMAAGRRLGVFTSQIHRWVRLGLLAGGYWEVAGRQHKLWWVLKSDLDALIAEGGRWAGIGKRKLRQKAEVRG